MRNNGFQPFVLAPEVKLRILLRRLSFIRVRLIMNTESFFTLAVHAGEDREAHHGALSVPVYNASVYAFSDAEEGASIHNEFKHGYYYGRLGNPTTEALEQTVAQLEGAESGLAFASGMAAI